MNEAEHNQKGSSSSSCGSSNPQEGETPEDAFLPRGTKIKLKVEIWTHMEGLLVIKTHWRGRKFQGALTEIRDSNAWDAPRLGPHPQKIEKRETLKRSKTKDIGPKLSQRQVFRRTFVDGSNIVESKLRYGRDKRIASYNSCPNSPLNSEDEGNHNLDRSSSFKKRSDETFTPSSESPLLREGTKCNKGDAEIRCNELAGIESDNSTNEFDNKLGIDKTKIQHFPRSDIEETDKIIEGKGNPVVPVKSTENNDERMPILQPVEPHLPRLKRVSRSYPANPGSAAKSSTLGLENYSEMDNKHPSNFNLQEDLTLTPTESDTESDKSTETRSQEQT